MAWRRIQSVALLAEGKTPQEVQAITRYSQPRWQQVVHCYSAHGLIGLRDLRHDNPGGPTLLSDAQILLLAQSVRVDYGKGVERTARPAVIARGVRSRCIWDGLMSSWSPSASACNLRDPCIRKPMSTHRRTGPTGCRSAQDSAAYPKIVPFSPRREQAR